MRDKKTLKVVATRAPGSTLVRGWILDGVGPARFGWATRYASGRIEYLGRTIASAFERIERDDAEDMAYRENLAREYNMHRCTVAASGRF